MSAIDPSPNAFPFASQEFALVGDTADERYPAFDISQPESFVDDTLCAHIDMGMAHAQEEAEVVQYEGPVSIVDHLSTAIRRTSMLTVQKTSLSAVTYHSIM